MTFKKGMTPWNKNKKLSKTHIANLSKSHVDSSKKMWKDFTPKQYKEICKRMSEGCLKKKKTGKFVACLNCGKKIYRTKSTENRKYCSRKCVIRPPHKEETKKKMRISQANYLIDNGLVYSAMGKEEPILLDVLEILKDEKIIRQYFVGGYFLDGYCKETNTAYEVDEAHHYINGILREQDIVRQRRIEDELGCEFVRIKI